jgi:hypothetical protein
VTFRDALAFFVGGAALGTLLVGVITVYQWLDPWKPAIIAVTMGALLSATIAFLYCNRDQPSAFIRGFAIWTLLALPTLAWGFAPVRAAALDLMSTQLSEQAQLNVIDDPHADVLQSACTALSEGTSMMIRARLAERFAASPGLGKACVEALAGANPARAASMSSNFVGQWKSALAAQNAPKVCELAPHLFELSTAQPAKPALPLTRCAVGEATSAVGEATSPVQETMATCCADALVDHYDSAAAYVDALGPTAELDERLLSSLFLSMTPYAFRNINASRHQLPQLQSELLRQKPTQDWLTELACNAMVSSYTPSEFFGGMEAIAQNEGCNLSIGDERGVSQWQAICTQWAQSPSEGLCPPIAHQAQGQAVSAASTQVQKALHAFYTSTLGRQIVAGTALLNRSDGTLEGFGSQISGALKAAQQAPSVGNAQLGHAARRVTQGSAGHLKKLQEIAPKMKGLDGADGAAVARDLLNKQMKNKPSWDEIKGQLTEEQQERVKPRLDEIYK